MLFRLKTRFYDGEIWKQELEARLMQMPMFDKDDVVLADDSEGLVRWTR
jgi:hypothetical protein